MWRSNLVPMAFSLTENEVGGDQITVEQNTKGILLTKSLVSLSEKHTSDMIRDRRVRNTDCRSS